MTIEEIWENITVLENKSYTSAAEGIFLCCLSFALLPIFIILSGMVGFNIDCFNGMELVLISTIIIIPAIISFVIYEHRPKRVFNSKTASELVICNGKDISK